MSDVGQLLARIIRSQQAEMNRLQEYSTRMQLINWVVSFNLPSSLPSKSRSFRGMSFSGNLYRRLHETPDEAFLPSS